MEKMEQKPADDQIYSTPGVHVTAAQVEEKLTRLMQSPGGLQKIAQQMLSPLKRDLLYEGRIRQLFQTYKLALGEEAVFDADVDVPAAAISVEGLPRQLEVLADRIRVETSPIAVRPAIRWNESNFRKYDILNRTQERAKASIMFQEDTKGFNLIDFASGLTNQSPEAGLAGTSAATNNPTVLTDTGKLSMEVLVEGIVTLRSKLLVASKIYLNPLRTKDLMLFNTTTAGTGGAGIFAPNFQDQAMKAGKVGSIWGCDVLESIVVPSANVYVLAPADYLGVLAVRTDVSVETLKDVNQMADVFAIWEDIGFLIRWAKGIVKITIS
jgi:hypothetical protein